MAISLFFHYCLGMVNDSNDPVAVPPNIENHVAINVIGILEELPRFGEIMPASALDNACPGFDLARRIRVLPHRLAQMPAGNDMHSSTILHIL